MNATINPKENPIIALNLTQLDIDLINTDIESLTTQLRNIHYSYVKGTITHLEYITTQADLYIKYSHIIGNHIINRNP